MLSELVESPTVIEQLDHRPAAVCSLDRELTAVNRVDAGGNIEPQRGGLRQRLDRKMKNAVTKSVIELIARRGRQQADRR
jgi:hypothetical protein